MPPIIRAVVILCFIIGVLFLPEDWKDLPVSWPILSVFPEWAFSKPMLLVVVLAVAYVLAEARNVRRWLKYRWLDADQSGRYLREMLQEHGAKDAAIMLDDIVETMQDGSIGQAAKGYLRDGVNRGTIAIQGIRRNGAAMVKVPTPLRDGLLQETFGHLRSSEVVGADEVVYEGVLYRREGIKNFVKKLK